MNVVIFRILASSVLALGCWFSPFVAYGQSQFKDFDVSGIYQNLHANTNHGDLQASPLAVTWWDVHTMRSQRNEHQPIPTDVNQLLRLALQHSNEIQVAANDPLIRETAIRESDSAFDWVSYFDTSFNDTSRPVSTVLDAGGAASRLNDNVFLGTAGLRRRNRYGGQLDISQQIGWQDNNSTFFTPGNQATGQFAINYSQPLLRGRGVKFNTSLVVLAKLDTEIAHNEFRSALQEQLLEISQGYWALYQERSILAQQVRLFLNTQSIVQQLQARQVMDAQRTQLITASAALESRRAALVRARTAVINAETRLRGLINAPDLGNAEEFEIVPIESPSLLFQPTDLRTELQTAIANRPEVHAAEAQIRAGATRLGVACHELLPALNLVTELFANGLRGDSEFGDAFVDQFTEGAPSYSIGLQYEFPIGNRLAIARKNRRQIELRQLQRQFQQALTAIETEVDIAVRELHTAYQEVQARSRALSAAEAEVATIQLRWSRVVDGAGNAGLNLESLLTAQERVTEAERDYVSSILLYNLAAVNLQRANGTLLNSERVVIATETDYCNGARLILDKQDDEVWDEVGSNDYFGQQPQPHPQANPLSQQPTQPAPSGPVVTFSDSVNPGGF